MKPHPVDRSCFLFAALVLGFVWPSAMPGQPMMENLGRGIVAIHQPDGKVA
jgi:hypothetical protein